MALRIKIICLALILLILSSCVPNGAEEGYSHSFFAMDTFMSVTLYGGQAEKGALLAEEMAQSLDALFSVTRPQSEIFAINKGGGAGVNLSAQTAEIIELSLSVSLRTKGAFDISIFPLIDAWGFTKEAQRVPDSDEIEALLALVGWEKVDISGEKVTLPAGFMLDLGAVAKGFCGDKIALELKAAGAYSGILRLGGNIHAIGQKGQNTPWKVAIADPANLDSHLGTVKIGDCALVTSGGYQRFFTHEGVDYWHILDPVTGYPAHSGLVSVTIMAESGALADALSTAFFVLGADEVLAQYREYGDFEAVLVTGSGEVLITPGIEDSFELLSKDYKLALLTEENK